MRVRRHRRLRKFLAWGTLVLLASLGGGLGFAYWYVTDSETIARTIRAEAPRYLPGSRVDLTRAGVRLLTGEGQVSHLTVTQTIDGRPFQTIGVPWMKVRHNVRAMIKGRFEPSEVIVAQPTLKLRRRKDGSWNLQGLLADPWPGPVMKTPPVEIIKGTVELSDGASRASGSAILRDVGLRIVSAGEGQLAFDGTAKGDTFDRITLKGTIDATTGQVEFQGDLARLAISDPLRSRLPADFKPLVEKLGLTGGEVDLKIGQVKYDPAATKTPKLQYNLSGRLHAGVWNCPKLPFPLNDLSVGFAVKDGLITLDRGEGFFGATTVRLDHARFNLADPKRAPFDLALEVIDLELDDRLRNWTPPEFKAEVKDIWKGFRPRGLLNASVQAVRDRAGGPVRHRTVVDCLDVAILYEHFKYPIDHVRGRFVWEDDRITIEGLQTLIGGQPLKAVGTIDNPGPNAIVSLNFEGRGLPIDEALLKAMPPEVRQVVKQFRPTGAVSGTLRLHRTPPEKPGDDPRGIVAIDAYLDLNERCGITWADLPYPVNNLTGKLEIHPNLWIFNEMKGTNGQAVITGKGRVEKVGGTPEKPDLKVDLRLKATKLPLDDQLRKSLPEAWRKSWEVLDPTGSADVDATINIAPRVPDNYHLEIRPGPATAVCLKYTREPKPGIDPGGTFKFRLEDVTGQFIFHNGPVSMSDVTFRFHDAPVKFARGWVKVEDDGRFDLRVNDLYARDIRLDQRLRSYMPPVMAQFAERLDDGHTFTLKGDLGLDWPGIPAPVRCRWGRAKVIFIDNTVKIQPGMKLEYVQGQIENVRGETNGETFELHGALNLASVNLLGQQITRLESPIDVDHGVARLSSISGNLLGGQLTGLFSVKLEDTPKYETSLAVRGADLQSYAKTLSGRQSFRGLVDGRLELNGFGGDLRTLQGTAEAHVLNGDLGELPVFLRLVKYLNLSPATKTAFDSADVVVRIRDGTSYFEPVRFTGDAFSLQGKGTMDVQGDLDLGLRVLYGRGRRLPLLSDVLREASGLVLVVRVSGTPSYPKFKLVAIPDAFEAPQVDRLPARAQPRRGAAAVSAFRNGSIRLIGCPERIRRRKPSGKRTQGAGKSATPDLQENADRASFFVLRSLCPLSSSSYDLVNFRTTSYSLGRRQWRGALAASPLGLGGVGSWHGRTEGGCRERELDGLRVSRPGSVPASETGVCACFRVRIRAAWWEGWDGEWAPRPPEGERGSLARSRTVVGGWPPGRTTRGPHSTATSAFKQSHRLRVRSDPRHDLPSRSIRSDRISIPTAAAATAVATAAATTAVASPPPP